MVRHYKKKTNRGEVAADAVMWAAREVKIKGASLRKAAGAINLSYASLRRYLTRIPDSELYDESVTVPSCSVGYNRNPRKPRPSVGSLETPVTIKTEDDSETDDLSLGCDPLNTDDSGELPVERTGEPPEECTRRLEANIDQKFRDEYEVAGWLYGNKLRSLDPEQRALAEKLVYDVLAKAKMKHLTAVTSVVEPSHR